MKSLARTGIGSRTLPILLLRGFTTCGVEAEQLDNVEVKRSGDFEVQKGGVPVEDSGLAPRLVVGMPKMPINLPEVSLKPAGNGRKEAEVKFPMAGGWAAALTSGGEEEKTPFEFDVAP